MKIMGNIYIKYIRNIAFFFTCKQNASKVPVVKYQLLIFLREYVCLYHNHILLAASFEIVYLYKVINIIFNFHIRKF